MKHKSSILLCEMDDGTLNLYVNGVSVMIDGKSQGQIEKIANCHHTNNSVQELLYKAHNMLIEEKE